MSIYKRDSIHVILCKAIFLSPTARNFELNLLSIKFATCPTKIKSRDNTCITNDLRAY